MVIIIMNNITLPCWRRGEWYLKLLLQVCVHSKLLYSWLTKTCRLLALKLNKFAALEVRDSISVSLSPKVSQHHAMLSPLLAVRTDKLIVHSIGLLSNFTGLCDLWKGGQEAQDYILSESLLPKVAQHHAMLRPLLTVITKKENRQYTTMNQFEPSQGYLIDNCNFVMNQSYIECTCDHMFVHDEISHGCPAKLNFK